MGIEIGQGQILGARQRQEDRIEVLDGAGGGPVLILADGMGGAVGGDVAAETIVGSVREALAAGDMAGAALRSAALAANKALRARVRDEPELDGMGGTVVIARLLPEGLMFFSMGDSPLLRVRAGRCERLNADHSVGGMLDAQAARGEISAEDAMSRRDRNSITSVLTGQSVNAMRMDETIDAVPLIAGDVLVLASDGLDTLSPEEIAAAVRCGDSARAAAQALLDAVAQAGKPRQDNCSVIVAKVS